MCDKAFLLAQWVFLASYITLGLAADEGKFVVFNHPVIDRLQNIGNTTNPYLFHSQHPFLHVDE